MNPILKHTTWLLGTLLLLTLTSCFTGVEGTKKISLSREDRKIVRPTAEELFLADITGIPLAQWQKGHKFLASDNRTVLIFDQEGLSPNPDDAALGGKILTFDHTETIPAPDGTRQAVIVFDRNGTKFRYNTGKNTLQADSMVRSDILPMLIDLEMVDNTRAKLEGKKLWTRTLLWYDDKGNRIPGRKFVPVTVKQVLPGNTVFPVKIEITDDKGNPAWLMMNFANSGKESRTFANIFMLDDLRKKYPQVQDLHWTLICMGKVAVGMTKEECKLALGNPTEVDTGRDYTQTLDLWHYDDGKTLWFEDGILARLRQ